MRGAPVIASCDGSNAARCESGAWAWYVACVMSALEHATHAELVERVAVRGTDREAESEVCRRFAERIRLYGLKHLRNDDRAQELVQRVLVTVIEALRAGRVEEPHHLDRFVLGVCRNLSSRLRVVEGRLEPVEAERLEQLAGLGVEMSTAALDMNALFDCVARLEPRAQLVLQLSFMREKSAEEIASVMATSAGNVRVVRHRAMAQLRDCMAAKEAA